MSRRENGPKGAEVGRSHYNIDDFFLLAGRGPRMVALGGREVLVDHRSEQFGPVVRGALIADSIAPRRSTSTSARSVQRQEYTYRPSPECAGFLPDNFELRFGLVEGGSGVRRFSPGGFEAFLPRAWLAGLALRLASGEDVMVDGLEPPDLWHVFQVARGMQEHFDRRFQYSRDLFLRLLARNGTGERNLLAASPAAGVPVHRSQWSIAQVRSMGRAAAKSAGYVQPTPEEVMAFGLWEVTRHQPPMHVSPELLPGMIRRALFADCESDGVDSGILAEIRSCAVAILREHDRDSTDEFDRRVLGPHNSFVKQVHARVKRRYSTVRRSIVRQGLLDLGWLAYRHVADCLDAVMGAIEHQLAETLVGEDLHVFQQVFRAQPALGNLPLALIAERMGFLKPVILQAWEEPDASDLVPVLHRLFWLYSEMARERRAADGRSKQHNNASHEAFDEKFHRRISGHTGLFTAVADHFRERAAVACDCMSPDWSYELLSASDDSIVVTCRCARCTAEREILLMREEFELTARQFRE